MNIAYVTYYNAKSKHAWSGTSFFIPKCLENASADVQYVGPLNNFISYFWKWKKVIYKNIFNKNYLIDFEPLLYSLYSWEAKNRINDKNINIVFSPGSQIIAQMQTDIPKVFWVDATFASMLNYYGNFNNLCSKTIRDGHRMEEKGLKEARLAIYSSDWAAQSAVKYYGADPEKIRIVPFGANISNELSQGDVEKSISKRSDKSCSLLFVGGDWERKGGEFAIEVARILIKQGIKTEIHIVGSSPYADHEKPDFVTMHGFINKDSDHGMNKLKQIYANSHFLILPTKAEAYGIVFCEASSFGVPSISFSTGGIPTVIKDGKNGQLFPMDTQPFSVAEHIANMMTHYDAYKELAKNSRAEYERRLNWVVAGKTVYDLLTEIQ